VSRSWSLLWILYDARRDEGKLQGEHFSHQVSASFSPIHSPSLCPHKDGWFFTGDIGQFMSDGSLRIVDRKKNLVKLKGGEYIALEKMEMTFGNSTFADAICCYGDGDMDRPVALVQLNKSAVMKWAAEKGMSGDVDLLKGSNDLYHAVLNDMHKEHAKSDLSHLEKLVGVTLLASPWTPENGCLTAANKLQRRVIIQQFQKEFHEVKKKGIF
jgi:long-chain acyl-CoA synthetase